MSFTLRTYEGLNANPLDVFERTALAEGFEIDRQGPRDLHITASGRFCDHQVWLVWDKDGETVRLFLAFDAKTPPRAGADVQQLLGLMNERLPVGHFDMWRDDKAIVYRFGILLAGQQKVTAAQASATLESAIDAADRFFPAYQFVIWGGKTPEEAVDAALIEFVAMS